MSNVQDFMTHDHRHCDDLFAAIEQAVAKKRWDDARARFDEFNAGMEAHLQTEEEVLFPAFENASGMTMGPTQVMRMEHEQMRDLLADMSEALGRSDSDGYMGQAETLLIMMQQHNMKEEGMLYPMCDQFLAASLGQLLPLLQEKLR